jgi:zinc finger RNA-binding protein
MMEEEERMYWEERRRYEEEVEYFEWYRRYGRDHRGLPPPPPRPFGPGVPPLMVSTVPCVLFVHATGVTPLCHQLS